MMMSHKLREVILAIEGGCKIKDSRGIVYRQEFGEAFLSHLKEGLAIGTVEEPTNGDAGIVKTNQVVAWLISHNMLEEAEKAEAIGKECQCTQCKGEIR